LLLDADQTRAVNRNALNQFYLIRGSDKIALVCRTGRFPRQKFSFFQWGNLKAYQCPYAWLMRAAARQLLAILSNSVRGLIFVT